MKEMLLCVIGTSVIKFKNSQFSCYFTFQFLSKFSQQKVFKCLTNTAINICCSLGQKSSQRIDFETDYLYLQNCM